MARRKLDWAVYHSSLSYEFLNKRGLSGNR